MTISRIAVHRPVWQTGSRRVLGPDEDLLTLAVDALTACLRGVDMDTVTRVVLVVSTPDVLNTAAQGVVRRAIGLADPVPVEWRLGGGPAALEALASAAPGTLVAGAESGPGGAASGAALVAEEGAVLSGLSLADGSLPMRVRHLDELVTHVYDDARLERERGWAPVLGALASTEGDTFVAGVPATAAGRLGAAALPGTDAVEAAAPFFVLAAMALAGRDGRLVAVDSALGCAVDVTHAGGADAVIAERPPVSVEAGPRFDSPVSDIPMSLPAYDRAFESRIGLVAAQCECGMLSYPPRVLCLECGALDRTTPVDLPRTGSVYSVVTIHIKVPGVASPFARAVVELDGVPVRILMPVTDSRPLDCVIGDHGSLVLRRIATREGIPDYGYSFLPDAREGDAA